MQTEEVKSKTKLQQAFELFLGKDSYRPVMHNPFEIDGKIYATDSFVLIRINKEDCDFEWANEIKSSPAAGKLFLEPNMMVGINMSSADFEQFKTADEYVSVGEDVDCGACKGEGNLEDSMRYKERYYHYEYECPVCDGGGIEQEAVRQKTGLKTFPEHEVKLMESLFSIKRFYKLIQVSELLGESIHLTRWESIHKGAMFKIGIAEIIIAPLAIQGEPNPVLDINNFKS